MKKNSSKIEIIYNSYLGEHNSHTYFTPVTYFERIVLVDGEEIYRDKQKPTQYLRDKSLLGKLEAWSHESLTLQKNNNGQNIVCNSHYRGCLLRKLWFKFFRKRFKFKTPPPGTKKIKVITGKLKAELMKKLNLLTPISRIVTFFHASKESEKKEPSHLTEHFYIRQDGLPTSFYESLHDHIQLSQQVGFPAAIFPLTAQIPNEYIGILEVWNEGRLLYRRYLQIQTEYVEKNHLYSYPIMPNPGPVLRLF